MSHVPNAPGQLHNKPLFFASFMTLIAAGMGFAIRSGVLEDWGTQFGFTKAELGTITGGGLVGAGIIIILSSLITDKVGYKPLIILAFLCHALSGLITVAATPIYTMFGKNATYQCLFWGMFVFALGNGLCEAVINPLVATLYPKQKTHYLNILHAGWPGGLIVGGLLSWFFVGPNAFVIHFRWEIAMSLFLIPTLIYGFIVIKERFPLSEARAAGVGVGTMFLQFLSPVLLLLLFLHACVGYVELGTDSWITNIMGNVVKYSVLVLVYTSAMMFVLRFFAGPIVEKINPVGLLFCSSCLGMIGLYLLGTSSLTLGAVFLAATVYGFGKAFLWPTMLGVVGERFPKGGAITMGAMGGIGMLSAGLLGGPGIGYKQDYFASQQLKQTAEPTYERYKSDDKNRFLFLPPISGLDGTKVAILGDDGKDLAEQVASLEKSNKKLSDDPTLEKTVKWWNSAKPFASVDKEPVAQAGIYGGQMALKWTAVVPAIMAVGYLLLLIYFRAKGGYRVEVLHGAKPEGERYTGGVPAPVE